jgi:hypothetical protein
VTLALDYSGANLVFVVGCPRSGTTWVQRLLTSHPRIRTGQESDVFDDYIGPQLRAWRRELDTSNSGRGGVGLGCYFEEADFLRLLKTYMLRLLEPMVGPLRPGELFVEKTPSHVLFVPEITALLPETRFIHVLRDARDTVASLLGAARGWGRGWAPRKAGGAASTWVIHVQAALTAQRQLPREQYLEVRYEDLHADGPGQLRRLADWLCLPWSDNDIASALANNAPERARAGKGTPIPLGGQFGASGNAVVREPEGFVRKAQAGTWRTDLSTLEKLAVWRVARTTMAEVGYPWMTPWSA